jgi:hypothetical protein
MILLLALAAWIVALSLVTGLCVAARAGDLRPERVGDFEATAQVAADGDRRSSQLLDWQPATHLEVRAHASVRPARPLQADASLAQSGSVAA